MESRELSLLKQNEHSAMSKAVERPERVFITSYDREDLFQGVFRAAVILD